MDIELKLTVLKQGKDKYCSLYCLMALCSYFGDFVTIDDMYSEAKLIDAGHIHIENAAIFAVNRGHNTYLVQNNLDVVAPLNPGSTVEVMKLRLANKFIELGGHYRKAIPTLELLDKNLRSSRPTIVIISNKMFDPPLDGNHYVIVSGMKGTNYVISDPSPLRQEKYLVTRQKLLKAWLNTHGYALYFKDDNPNAVSGL